MNSTETKLIAVTESIADLVDRVKKEESDAAAHIAKPAAAANMADENLSPTPAEQHHTHVTPQAHSKRPSKARLHTTVAVVAALAALVVFQDQGIALFNPAEEAGNDAQLVQSSKAALPTPTPVVAAAPQQTTRPETQEASATPIVAQNETKALPAQTTEEVKQADATPLAAASPHVVDPAPETPPVEVAVQPAAPTAIPETAPVATPGMGTNALPDVATKTETPPVAPTQPTDMPKRNDWLLAQPADSYTVQIAAMSNAQALQRFISANKLEDRTAYFQFSRNNKQLHVAVLDIFEEPGKARLAIKQLPPEVAEMKPWVRKLSSIQKIITSN